jgi:photosystem II stability/assembly factor-like uncharacterized protein
MRRVVLAVLVLFALGSARGPSALAVPQFQVISQDSGFLTLAVDHNGVAYGSPVPVNGTYSYMLYRSTDEGQTWSHIYDFPSYSHMYFVSVLSDNTLLAHVDTGAMNLYRSTDGGSTWARVLTMPTSPVFYTTLTAHSVTDLVTQNTRYVFAGSYNLGDSTNHTNYIWRSADDGATWSLVYQSINHRHIHFIQANPYNGALYVGYGDAGSQVSIERSTDQGISWTPICPGDPCKAVDIAFDPAGFAIFGQDNPFSDSYIMKMDVASGALTPITKLPGPSYSDLRLSQDVWLVGETHEPGMVDDGYVHLFASDDGGNSFVDVFKKPYLSANSYSKVLVQFAYPNGDIPVRIDGYGTILGRIVSSTPLPDFAVSGSPSSQTVTAGGSASYSISVSVSNGFSGNVALSATGLPSGSSATFAPETVAAPGNATLTVTSSSNTPAGSYPLTVTGTATDGTTHSTSLTYIVTAQAVSDFVLDVSPKSRQIAKKTSTTYTASITATGGFSGVVSFAITGLPAGATASFSPATVNTSGSSKLTVNTAAGTPAGQYTLQIQASSGSISHTSSVKLTVR